MFVHQWSLGPLKTNCYFVVCNTTDKMVIIDPGDEGSFLSEKILELKLKPLFIILTHSHFDHCLAAGELRLNFKIPLLVHSKDEFLLKKAGQSADYWLGSQEKVLLAKKWQTIQDGDKITFGRERLKVIHTSGHTPGSICLYNKKAGVLFSGDLIFKDGVGRTDFSYSSIEKLQDSLKKIFALPAQTRVYPGHGEKFILGNAANRSFLGSDVPV